VIPAAGIVAFLMSGDGITHYCSSVQQPLAGYECLPTLSHALTGSEPIPILLSWTAVGVVAYVGLLGWVFAAQGLGWKRRGADRMTSQARGLQSG
jgi:hypothetical protein